MISLAMLEDLKGKQFFRFTGTPEHWLTAIKFKTWGLKENLLSSWQKIEVGDVFLMHSTAKSNYKGAKSSIIGVGVVGPGLRQKTDYLWEEEFEKRENIYPWLVPFSEIYLFSEELNLDGWEPTRADFTQELIGKLVKDARPLPARFPAMGSMSSVNENQALSILHGGLPPTLIESEMDVELYDSTPTKLIKLESAKQGLRYIPTLKYLEPGRTARTYSKSTSTFERNNELLERAESEHQRIIDEAIPILKSHGYDILGNLHIDLAAENEKEILLFEAKSIPKNGFRTQARRAIGQLYQYEYFDINEYQKKNLINKAVSKRLLIPFDPIDSEYLQFLKWANVTPAIPLSGLIRML